ncbi:hypothetical protein N8D56_24995 (plasmid) [Devosia sp. A8/3-2]|nr:hypothetical protein N8D56_24995 [Devosia sp. A8/3-2]
MANLTLVERKERRALAKATISVLKKIARPHKWKVARGSLFREHNGWFIEVWTDISPWERKTDAHLKFKPMAVDPTFWEIVGFPENSGMPLSFRAFGAWVCGSPTIAKTSIKEDDGSPEAIAGNILAWVNAQMTQALMRADHESYLDLLTSKGDGYFDTRIALLCTIGRYAEARRECRQAVEREFGGGFEKIGKDGEGTTFPMMVLDWIDRR